MYTYIMVSTCLHSPHSPPSLAALGDHHPRGCFERSRPTASCTWQTGWVSRNLLPYQQVRSRNQRNKPKVLRSIILPVTIMIIMLAQKKQHHTRTYVERTSYSKWR
jgi:hypothetical protein